MKKYIKSTTEYMAGSYLVDRQGALHTTILHAPSTTYINRGLMFLAPSDADLLYELGKISDEDVEVVLAYNYKYFLENEAKADPSMITFTRFNDWAELKYAQSARRIFMKSVETILDIPDIDSRFQQLTDKWYPWLQNNFVKLSVINTVAEFRITSEDGFDWNDIIIDNVILEHDWKRGTTFNILKEDENGYRAYFFNATMDDILEEDDVVLSSTYIDRKIIDGKLVYV